MTSIAGPCSERRKSGRKPPDGIACEQVHKLQEGRPHILDRLTNGEIQLVINTPSFRGPRTDEAKIRQAAIRRQVPIITTLQAAAAAVNGIDSLKKRAFTDCSLHEHIGGLAP